MFINGQQLDESYLDGGKAKFKATNLIHSLQTTLKQLYLPIATLLWEITVAYQKIAESSVQFQKAKLKLKFYGAFGH